MAEKRVSDYNYRFISPPPDDVICPLCLDIVEEPYQFTCCGQHVCKKCGDKLKQQDTTPLCPMCRHNECTMLPDKYFERNVLKKLMIWCTKGCGQKVELGQLKNHLTQCPCVQEDCPYGCGQQYQRQYIEEHKEKCPKHPFICGYCKYQSTYEVIVNEHYPVCDKYPIICPNECSGDEIERGMLQDHLDKCPFQMVECEFSHVGCQEKVRRCDLGQHLSDNGVHHTALFSKMMYESLQKIMEEKDRLLQEKDRQLLEKDRQLQEKDKRLDLLLSEIHKLGLELRGDKKDSSPPVNIYDKVCGDTVLSVTIERATYKKDKKFQWYSPPYFTHRHYGYLMWFEVDFNYSHRIGLLAIFSLMISGPYDDILEWPFKGKVIVRLLNQCGDHHHYDYVFDYKDNDRGKRVTSGERGAALSPQGAHLPLDQLDYNADTNCQYLKDDHLKFEVSVLFNKVFIHTIQCVK